MSIHIKYFCTCFLTFLLVAVCSIPTSAQVVINELIPANTGGYLDEDNDSSDWIELVNLGPDPVGLTGWGLSDDSTWPGKWRFPQYDIDPGEHLVVFASGKDRQAPNFWHTVVDRGALFRYRANLDAPAVGWHLPGFDDTLWLEGPSGIGYGDNDDATVIPECVSASMRHQFTVENLSETSLLVLHVDFDDGFIVWLNGTEIIRENLNNSGEIVWDSTVASNHEAQMYFGSLPNRYVFPTDSIALQEGSNLLSIEVHNGNNITGDLSMIPFLTLGVAHEPTGGATVSEEIDELFPLLHTNFKLAANGEEVFLVNSLGELQDTVSFGAMVSDFSFGRAPNGTGSWLLMESPTPGQINHDQAFSGFADPPSVDIPGGIFSGPVTVEIFPPASGGEVHFVNNPNDPDENDLLINGPITITETTVIRARTFATGLYPSTIMTHTYIVADPSDLPITSLVSDPHNLFDRTYGILWEDNIWEDWERPIHVEFFETDGTVGLSQDAGVQLFGGGSRQFAQKSMRVIARTGYGDDSFTYPVFPERSLGEYSQLVFRNSGSEWLYTMCRDGLAHQIINHLDVDHLAYRPSRVYINGIYWGILNAREHIDVDYVASNNGVDADNLDLIKDHFEVVAGDRDHYAAMVQYPQFNWLGYDDNYAHMQTLMNMENFIDYNIFEIFFANTDWPGQNIACWRPRTPEGRWRWIMFDLDFGLGYLGHYDHDTLEFALSYSSADWPNPFYSTFLLRSLMNNDQFKHQFINSYCDHLNTTFQSSRTEAIRQRVSAAIEPEIVRHKDTWDLPLSGWTYQMAAMQEFLQLRPAEARDHLRQKFQLEDDVSLTVTIDPPGCGAVRLSAVTVDTSFTGMYFRNHSLQVTAVPANGYVFAGWANPERPQEVVIDLSMAENDSLTAVFSETPLAGTVVINEICYNPAATWDTEDWVELHNPGETPMDISGWRFRDSDDAHLFVLPEPMIIPAGGYAVLCRNTVAFHTFFPDVTTVPGDLGFGFSGAGEVLRLFDANDNIVDIVQYDDNAPWPTEPDGTGATLQLVDPWLDNSLALNWVASVGHGSPGNTNADLSVVDDFPQLFSIDLLQPHPNPFNPSTNITFTLDRSRRVDVTVYDLAGRRVRTLAIGIFERGRHHLMWNGLNDGGQGVSSGIYFVGMKTGDFQATRKVMMLK